MIYFDNNATTQIAPQVSAAMLSWLDGSYGNPSAAYGLGAQAKDAIEESRQRVADLLGARRRDEIVFTSGGTESDNWAIMGALRAGPGKKHLITTRVEHEAVRKLCRRLEHDGYRISWIEVDENGGLDLDGLRAGGPDTAVVSTMLANNETGILFPIKQVASIVKANSDALFHVDGVCAAGKVPVDLKSSGVDLFSISAHKFHGPKGVGALYIREGIDLPSLLIGGGQERGRRAGTEAVHQIAGLAAAAEFARDLTYITQVSELRNRLENEILHTIPDSFVNGDPMRSRRLPNTSSISFANTNGEMILTRLDTIGICVSTGSACNVHDHRASAVLEAMNVPYSRAMGAIRFSLSRFNTAEEVEFVLTSLPGIVRELRALAR